MARDPIVNAGYTVTNFFKPNPKDQQEMTKKPSIIDETVNKIDSDIYYTAK